MPDPLGHLIPMYVYPADLEGGPDGARAWAACSAACRGGTPVSVVANVADGVLDPAAPLGHGVDGPWSPRQAARLALPPPDPFYAAAVAGCVRDGATVLGYVNTQHGTVPVGLPDVPNPSTVLGQAALWRALYPEVGGFLVDQVPTSGTPAERRYYTAVAQGVEGAVVVNSGAVPLSDWLLADVGADVVVYENDVAAFEAFEPPPWMGAHPPEAFAAVLHDARATAEVVEVCDHARRAGFGSVYVTDGRQASGNPYDGLPSPAIWRALRANS